MSAGPRRESPRPSSWFDRQFLAEGEAALGIGRGQISVKVPAPRGKKFADGAPVTGLLEVSRRSDLLIAPTPSFRAVAEGGAVLALAFEVMVEPFTEERIESELVIRLDAMVCGASEEANGEVCEPHTAWVRLPVRLAQAGGSSVAFSAGG